MIIWLKNQSKVRYRTFQLRFEEKENEKEAYADAVAQGFFEQAMAMGYSYDEALKKAQAALESSEKEFDELDEERTAYADAMAQQQYEA